MSASPLGPGVPVYIQNHPQGLGVTTGETRSSGSKEYVQVKFGGKTEFVPASMLRIIHMDTSLDALADRAEYSQPVALRRLLAHAKISGDLTNIFYSMESSQTDFYPHQFKPVLKFLDSPYSRLLIADEVGLGKTIEALFIWKELQAREQATRLLVVCPAMLRTKWLGDLQRRFGIVGRIVNADELLGELRLARDSVSGGQFALITSLEAIRSPRDFADTENQSPRATLARYIDAGAAGEDDYLLDLAIIDEAHYLRNPDTANHRIGNLLRDAARHLVLLTATPIQIRSENLFHLLRLLDPDRFASLASFNELIDANIPIVRAQRSLWRTPPDLATASESLASALAGRLHTDDSRLSALHADLQGLAAAGAVPTAEQRLQMIGRLESRSLLAEYMTRSRKREVVGRRVHRRAQTPIIRFTEDERAVYEGVTNLIRQKAEGLHGVASFALITRQRQMASCIVAALSSWDDSGFLRESLWSDLGTQAVLDLDEEEVFACDLNIDELASPELCARLRQADSKYAALLSVLRSTDAYDPSGKVIIFAFFRGTLKYLQSRLVEDGIIPYLIMGGMGPDQDLQIEAFRRHHGRAVLLSSEVGSEGIDLQFCSALINYDLPWNPMRVEQRIGRLDRIGQAAEAISITNLFHEDSIEDRILARLYERIEVFKDTIGDLEEILGACVEQLRTQFFDPSLSDEERERAADERILALARDREQRRQLEEQAVNLVSFGDYILQQVSRSRDRGHWIKPSDYLSYVADFLEARYPETNITVLDAAAHEYDVLLAEEARVDFEAYLQQSPQSERTMLHRAQRPIRCSFDPKSVATSRTAEQLRIGHPLIRWIQETIRDEGNRHPPLVAAKIDSSHAAEIAAGVYVFLAQIWQFSGLVDERLLRFGGQLLETRAPLLGEAAEFLVTRAAESGQPFLRLGELRELSDQVRAGLSSCGEELLASFQAKEEDFSAENMRRCSLQEAGAIGHAERTISRYRDTIRLLESKGRRDLLHLWTARIDRAEQELRVKQKRIEEHRQVQAGFQDLCAGVIIVEG